MKDFYLSLAAGKLIDSISCMSMGDLAVLRKNGNLAERFSSIVSSYGPMLRTIFTSYEFDREDIAVLVSTVINYVQPVQRVYLMNNRAWAEREITDAIKRIKEYVQA